MYNKSVANYYFPFLFLFFASIIIFIACKKEDKKLIVGKWQNEQDWFEYFENGNYNSGKSFVTLVHNFKYSLDKNKHELTMYTDNESETYYLKYEFIGEDTLAVRNQMSSNTNMIKFYRVKKQENKE